MSIISSIKSVAKKVVSAVKSVVSAPKLTAPSGSISSAIKSNTQASTAAIKNAAQKIASTATKVVQKAGGANSLGANAGGALDRNLTPNTNGGSNFRPMGGMSLADGSGFINDSGVFVPTHAGGGMSLADGSGYIDDYGAFRTGTPDETFFNSKFRLKDSSVNTEATNLRNSLGTTSAPSSASSINSGITSPVIPTLKSEITGIGGNIASNAANQLLTQGGASLEQKRYDDLIAEKAANIEKQKSWLSDFMQKTPQDAGDKAAKEINFNAQQHFLEQQSKEKEVEVLSLEYNKVKQAMDEQLAASTDKLASNNFINNQMAQIERNAAPKLNRIAADINTKQATLAQMRGDFEEARGYIKDAIAAATSEQKYKFDMWTAMNQLNEDSFKLMSEPVKDALNRAYKLAEKDYDRTLDEKDKVGELMLKYNHLGAKISINDTFQDAIRKASRFGTSSGSGGGTESERQQAAITRIGSALSPGNTLADGTPIYDTNGFITPKAWSQSLDNAPSIGVSREAFIKQFGSKVFVDKKGEIPSGYGLTPVEKKYILGS